MQLGDRRYRFGDARRRGPGGAARLASPCGARCRGFSLLEVLVAFVILTLVATALFRLFSGSLSNASAADEYSRAVLIAESALIEATAAQPLREESRNGTFDDGRIAWTTRVEAYTPSDVPPDLATSAEMLPTRLYRVTAEVSFPSPSGGKRTFALSTIKLAAREAR